jgi:transposase InsO family protein
VIFAVERHGKIESGEKEIAVTLGHMPLLARTSRRRRRAIHQGRHKVRVPAGYGDRELNKTQHRGVVCVKFSKLGMVSERGWFQVKSTCLC